jgi:SAM-dependent methyltransferase
MSDLFYKAFEEKHRGSRELIKSRLKAYLPFIQPMLQFYPNGPLVDLGCGRGEWLELTAENGFEAQGVDLDEGMLESASELGLMVKKMDALTFLKQLPDNSQAIVSGFHIAEHIAFEQLQQLVLEAKRVLVAGGLLILETPNPENLMVGTNNFYLDPTHQRPLPPELLYFLPEHFGFARQKILRLQEPQHLAESTSTSLMDVISGVSPDYSVIAQKDAPTDVLHAFDAPFKREYGLTLQSLAERFQLNLTHQLDIAGQAAKAHLLNALQIAQTAQEQTHQARVRADKAEALADSHFQEKESKLAELTALRQELNNLHQANHQHWQLAEQRLQQIEALYSSKSWRITAPLRWLRRSILLKSTADTSSQVTKSKLKNSDFSSLSSRDSAPMTSHSDEMPANSGFSKMLMSAWAWLQNHPKLRAKLMRILRIFPAVEFRLRRIHLDHRIKKHAPCNLWQPAEKGTQDKSMEMVGTLGTLSIAKSFQSDVFTSRASGVNATQRSPLEAFLAD